MSRIMNDLIVNEKKEIAVRMLADGELSLEKIAKYTGLSVEKVGELEENKTKCLVEN